jgi:hypothetical protein
MDEAVESVRKANIEAGLDPKYMGQFIHWRDDRVEKKNI